MMSHELAYFLKVNVAIILFYALYRLFYYKDTFFKWRRVALLCFLGISMLYPLLNFQDWMKEQEPVVAMADIYSTLILPEISIDLSNDVEPTHWKFILVSLLQYLYWGGVGVLALRFLVQLFGILRIGLRTPTAIIQQTKVHLLNKPQGPFSFFHWIFVHPNSHTEEELEEILTHERTHASQWHSIDVLFSELMCMCCWFNPFIWLMKREIRNNLEFMADHKVLETGHDCKTYQYHLLGLAHQKSVATLYNSFNVLPLKIRIKMMNKKRTKQIGRTKYLLFLPLAALLLIVSNIEAIARSTERLMDNVIQPEYIIANDTETSSIDAPEKKFWYKGVVVDQDGKPLNKALILIDNESKLAFHSNSNGEFAIEAGKKVEFLVTYNAQGKYAVGSFKSNSKSKDREDLRFVLDTNKIKYVPQEVKDVDGSDVVFEIVEQMPEFPGGNSELMQFLAKNIKYPMDAIKNSIEGRVIVQFIITKDGDVVKPKVVRNVNPELDNEAIRIVKLMPKWQPGKQRGKAVDVKYTIPIAFRLQPSSLKSDTESGNNDVVVVGYAPKHMPVEGEIKDEETVFEIVEQMPEYPGGLSGLMDFLRNNIKYPEVAHKNKTEGRVIVQFIVAKDGTVKNPGIIRSVSPELDAEALRVIGLMGNWIPGKQRGKEVNAKYTVPISFKLTTSEKKAIPEPIQIEGETVYTVADSMPEFPGGLSALMEYMKKENKYANEISGERSIVIVQFVVGKDGSIKYPKVVRDLDPYIDKEVLRIVTNMPKWIPGKVNGEAVSVKYTIPVVFGH